VFWWRRLFSALQVDLQRQITIQCDNRQTIDLLTRKDAQYYTKLRHIDIYHHWLRQEAQQGRIDIRWTPTASMGADGLTKLLPAQKHQEFVKMLGLHDLESFITA